MTLSEFITRLDDIAWGSVVLCLLVGVGLILSISTKFLTGLLIGYVSEVGDDSNRLTRSGTIIPAADFKNIREVLVIRELKQTKENS